MAIKWIFDGNYSFKDEEFARIYRFYVIETPVSGVSARAKSFKFRQINMNSLNASLRRETPFLKDKWFVKSAKEVEGSCKDNGIDENVRFANEIVIHTENRKLCTGKTDSMFYAIRCAFAHGSFAIHKYKNQTYYVLENKDSGVLKARMVLKEETLIKWIEIVETFPKAKTKTIRRKLK